MHDPFSSLKGGDEELLALRCFRYSFQWTLSSLIKQKFQKISKLLSQAPTAEKAIEFVFRSVPGENELRRAVEISLQEYTITERLLVGYFLRNDVSSLLKAQNDQEIEEWVLSWFRDGRFPTSCMSCLVSGKVLLKFQVENSQEMSTNRCSQPLRKFTYGILASAPLKGGNRTTVQEWDREGFQVKSSIISPVDGENIPCLREIPSLDLDKRLAMYLDALHSNTTKIKSLPEELKLVGASLRFLYRKANPKLKPSHLSAILCGCVKLEDGSWRECLEKSKDQPFDVQAAHSFSQWQCVLRDAIHLNRVLHEPVPTPYIRNIFNGQLVHNLQRKLERDSRRASSILTQESLSRYQELYTAITDEEEEVAAGIQKVQLQASKGEA
ncbi:protein asteroid homolog 1-like [Stylophora pistillata]|uniref:protein asteroid homolog 1-like n=1 Tax=Stylophora pistillata TaxID=50429 RepID=UPI000C05295A|nr:protein asteroid homolog 1-like [Stylophora pistillata]